MNTLWETEQTKPDSDKVIYNDDVILCNDEIYESVSALVRDILDNPSNYGINGEIYKIEEGSERYDSDLRVWYTMPNCSCTVDEDGNDIKDVCDCDSWYEDFDYSIKNIVTLAKRFGW